jgi:hypothetical protein
MNLLPDYPPDPKFYVITFTNQTAMITKSEYFWLPPHWGYSLYSLEGDWLGIFDERYLAKNP